VQASEAGAGAGSGAEVRHGACLTTDDVDRVQNFVNEFCVKALLPHMERQVEMIPSIIVSLRVPLLSNQRRKPTVVRTVPQMALLGHQDA